MPSGQQDVHKESKRTDGDPRGGFIKDTRKETLSAFLDNQALRTNPFGENVSAEYIYRRAERIAAAIHLISEHIDGHEPVRSAIREESIQMLRRALALRSELRASGSENVRKMQASLRELISLTRILGVSGRLSAQNAHILVDAIDELGNVLSTSQRSTLAEAVALSRDDFTPRATATATQKVADVVRVPLSRVAREPSLAHSQRAGVESADREKRGDADVRAARIMDILKSGGLLGIKDITSHVPEYSEKMVQRALAKLTAQNLIVKTGAKRWSRYEIVR